MISRRAFLTFSASLCLPMWPMSAILAQDYPSRPIRFIVPTSPGTATDLVARYMGRGLGKALGTSVVVENKVGAGGVIGTEFVAKAAPDGYTILFTYSSHYSNPWVFTTSYDAVGDFEPIARLASSALVLVTGANSQLRSLNDVITASRNTPNSLMYGSAGNGTTSHMAAALMLTMADIQAVHVPYKTPSEAAVGAAGKQVDIVFGGFATYLPLIKGGRLRALAVTGTERSATMPDVPTMAEAALPGYEIVSSTWALAPRGTPRTIVSKLSDIFVQLAASPEYEELCLAQGNTVDVQDAAAFGADAPAQLDKWKRLVDLTKHPAH